MVLRGAVYFLCINNVFSLQLPTWAGQQLGMQLPTARAAGQNAKGTCHVLRAINEVFTENAILGSG